MNEITQNEYFYLIPQKNTESLPKTIDKIDISIFNNLAQLSTSLVALENVKEEKYILALYHYFEAHKDNNLYDTFFKILGNGESAQFLSIHIHLILLEKYFRNNGIHTQELIENYNFYASEYQKQLALNNEHYNEIQKKSSTYKLK